MAKRRTSSNKRIESELMRERLLDIITRWCKHTKTDHLLREYDISGLVGSLLGEFYRTSLCCGHLVKSFEEGVHIAFKDVDGVVSGLYCSVCAEEYKKKLGAWEVRNDQRDG